MSQNAIPSDKFDLAAIDRARKIGFPELTPHIPDLLEWLQDPNWPVFQSTADLLAEAGPDILVPLRVIFASDDIEWIETLLRNFCPRLPPDLLARLKPDIEGLPMREDLRDRADIKRLVNVLTTT